MLESLTHTANATIPGLEGTWIGNLQEWTSNLPEALQGLGVLAISAIPFIESYGGSVLGIFAGVHPAVAIIAAIIGNILSLALVIYVAHGIRVGVTKNKQQETDPKRQARQQKVKERLDKFGVPGVALLGPIVMASQITAPMLVGFGANRNAVMVWTSLSAALWGGVFGALGIWFLSLLSQ